MNKKLTSFAIIGSVIGSLFLASAVYAATPTLSAFYTGNGDYVQVNVANADPNDSVLLDTTSNIQALGTTNSSGAFSATISTSAYGISPGSVVYVTVDGQQSSPIEWPYTASTNTSFSLSQTSLSITVGQSAVITASTGGPFYLSSNSSPSVANVALSGSQITVTANTVGTTNLTICVVSDTSSCETATVNVTGGGSETITFSQNNLDIPIGQTATVDVEGGTGAYTITNNSNPSSVGATISSNVVSLYASNLAGTAAITVCSTDLSSCGVIDLTVGANPDYSALVFSNTAPSLALGQGVSISITGGIAPYYVSSNSNSSIVETSLSGNVVTLSGMAAGTANVIVCSDSNDVCGTLSVTVGTASSGNLSFSQTDVTLTPGESDTISVSGAGTYYISSNSNSSVASAQVNGAEVIISGSTVGTDNISVCSSSGECGTVYVSVASSGTTTTTTTGSSLTLTQVLSVGQGVNILLSGGSAPYSISSNPNSVFSAVMNSGEVLTLTGVSAGESSITVCSSNGICMPVYVDVTNAVSGITGTTAPSTSQYDFTTLLTYGSTGAAVTALQEQLTNDGLYTGPITGYYGDLTTAAVEAFQSKHGISSVGYVGPSTRAALNAGE